jgi:hypothetical protein
MRVAALTLGVALSVGAMSFPNTGMAASPGASGRYTPPTAEQMASIGCIVAGTATAALVGTVGAMSVAATGGSAAAYSIEALPILGAAFAAGCGVGMMAAPGAAWLLGHVGYLVNGRDEASDIYRAPHAVHDGTVELASSQ